VDGSLGATIGGELMASIDGQEIRGELVTLGWAAKHFNISPQLMSVYKVRTGEPRLTPTGREAITRNPFPQPVLKIGVSDLYRLSELEEWNARRQPRASTE